MAGKRTPPTTTEPELREAEHRFGRKVAWGVDCGDERHLFTTLSIPVMTRLRQPERQVLDTLVAGGVAFHYGLSEQRTGPQPPPPPTRGLQLSFGAEPGRLLATGRF